MDKYVITDGTRYIAQNKAGSYVPEYDASKALVLSKRDAEKIYYNNLAKPLRKVFRLSKDAVPVHKPVVLAEKIIAEPVKVDDTKTPDHKPEVKLTEAVSEQKSVKKELKYTRHYDTKSGLDNELTTQIVQVVEVFKSAATKKTELQSKLDKVEKEIVDINHYIEFKSLNACDGYNAYRMLRDRLTRRRKLKNELKVAEILAKGIFTTSDITDIEKVIDSFDKNQYRPRVLNDLFE